MLQVSTRLQGLAFSAIAPPPSCMKPAATHAVFKQREAAGGRPCTEFIVIHVSAEHTRDERAAPVPARRWHSGDNSEERVERDIPLPRDNANVAVAGRSSDGQFRIQ